MNSIDVHRYCGCGSFWSITSPPRCSIRDRCLVFACLWCPRNCVRKTDKRDFTVNIQLWTLLRCCCLPFTLTNDIDHWMHWSASINLPFSSTSSAENLSEKPILRSSQSFRFIHKAKEVEKSTELLAKCSVSKVTKWNKTHIDCTIFIFQYYWITAIVHNNFCWFFVCVDFSIKWYWFPFLMICSSITVSGI